MWSIRSRSRSSSKSSRRNSVRFSFAWIRHGSRGRHQINIQLYLFGKIICPVCQIWYFSNKIPIRQLLFCKYVALLLLLLPPPRARYTITRCLIDSVRRIMIASLFLKDSDHCSRYCLAPLQRHEVDHDSMRSQICDLNKFSGKIQAIKFTASMTWYKQNRNNVYQRVMW